MDCGSCKRHSNDGRRVVGVWSSEVGLAQRHATVFHTAVGLAAFGNVPAVGELAVQMRSKL